MEETRELFEEMTRINNELLNTRRLLEQQKAKIEELNGELGRRNDLLSSLLASIKEAVIGLDEDGTVVFLNNAAERLAGWTGKDVEGYPVRDVIDFSADDGGGRPRRGRELLERARETIARGAEWTFPSGAMVENRHGRRTPVAGAVLPVAASFGPAHRGSLVVLRDITEELKAQRSLLAANRLEAAEGIASGVLHTYNTLLMVMVNNARTLRIAFPDNPDIERVVTRIEDASARAERLSDQLIQFTRSDVYAAARLDLNRVVREVVESHRPRSEGVGIELDLEAGLPPIDGDAEMIRRLVTAIWENAMDALSEPTAGRIRVRTENAGTDGRPPGLDDGPSKRFVRLAVEDDGCGMDEETRRRAFEPFFSTKFLGRGLGLSLAYGIVRNHGGVMRLESRMGEGSTVEAYLPAASE